MTKLKIYKTTIDAGDFAFNCFIPATSENDAFDFARGNGDILKIEDATDTHRLDISEIMVALKSGGISEIDRDIICRTLFRVGIAD